MAQDGSQSWKEQGRLTPFGREWRTESRSELLASTIRMPHFEGPKHGHPEAQVAILLSGSKATFNRAEALGSIRSPIAPGCFVYIPPDELHTVQWQGWTELLNLYWNTDFLRELIDQSNCASGKDPMSYCFDPAVQSIGRILMDEFLRTRSLPEMMIDHGRALVASRILQLTERRVPLQKTGLLPGKRLENALDAMIANPEKDFTLLELARLCHSSVFHFSRSFTAHLGCPPFAFQRNLRMQKAKELLLKTNLSVEAISRAVGLESPTSFSRVFRLFIGQSPREFRRANSGEARF